MFAKSSFLIVIFSLLFTYVSGQSDLTFHERRYHKTEGWVNSGGVYVGGISVVLTNFTEGLSKKVSSQVDFVRYKLVTPKYGLGGGLAYKQIATGELDYERYDAFRFAEIFIFGKAYLNNKQRRLFTDAKLGFGIPLGGSIEYGCYACDEPITLGLRYSSTIMIQPGIGFEFASAKESRWGVKLSPSISYVEGEQDVSPRGGFIPLDGVIKSKEVKGILPALMIGFNIYI